MNIDVLTSEKEGLNLVFENESWVVGIKNYKPANDIMSLSELERHNKTDEQFVLLDGECHLVSLDADQINVIKMEKNTVYNIPAELWHTTIMKPGTRMILVERSGTSMDNSEMFRLNQEQISTIKGKILLSGR